MVFSKLVTPTTTTPTRFLSNAEMFGVLRTRSLRSYDPNVLCFIQRLRWVSDRHWPAAGLQRVSEPAL